MKKAVGILVELEAGRLKPANAGVITLARSRTDAPLFGIAVNADSDADLEKYGAYLAKYGMDNIVGVTLPKDRQHNPDVTARVIIDVMKANDVGALFGLSTSKGKDILPRIAAALDAPLVMDCVDVDLTRGMAKTSQYSGKTMATIKVAGHTLVFGIRPNVIDPVETPVQPQLAAYDGSHIEEMGLTVESHGTKSGDAAVSLAEANVIVAGGRGMKNGDNFSLLTRCARLLNGAAASSRVAVDSGWVPYAMQVGQTGEKVSPGVYIACGISGSIQHFAGMKTSGMIIAINTDENAAIVANCDYWARADALKVIPHMIRILENG